MKIANLNNQNQVLDIVLKNENDHVVAIAGNPNVGKSTVFNNLTGMKQHTGNWPGKTVVNAQGYCNKSNKSYVLVDIPGTYSLMAHSAEEEVARNFLCFGGAEAVVVVCDATCLERNLNLVLQCLEISKNVIVCVNLMDEAKRKNINIDLVLLSKKLGVPVTSTVARNKKSLKKLLTTLDKAVEKPNENYLDIEYIESIEQAIKIIEPVIKNKSNDLNSRWLSLRLLENDKLLNAELIKYLGQDFFADEDILTAVEKAEMFLKEENINSENIKDKIVASLVLKSEDICNDVVTYNNANYNKTDRKIDKIMTSKIFAFPLMFVLFLFIFWVTITGANYPSGWISSALFYIQEKLTLLFEYFHAPAWLHGVLVLGVYRVLAWVVSVMLPPMAIFFPLFTFLEDIGYLPRIAYNLDKPFKKCKACGKQALTMCMGFGCNAAGVIGCRIIDSPRERLLAILTNNFVPCNGRFPTLIAIIGMFFVAGTTTSFTSALLLSSVILFGVLVTFLVTKILSSTILKGIPSSFTLELPPYRKPQVGKLIVRSIFDRTLFVLGRAVVVAAPMGLVIWSMANVYINDVSILNYCSSFLDPFANLMGLDGVILLAFILGFPANEIVVPIIIMAYMSQGAILELDSLSKMHNLFVQNGWTWITAVSTMLFSLMHWPCSTTILTIKKETNSLKWTALSFIIPTILGVITCIAFTSIARLFV